MSIFSPFRNLLFKQPTPTFNSRFGNPEQEELYPIPTQQPRPTTLADGLQELLMRKEGPAMSEYKKYIQAGAPDPEQHKVGKLGRLGAILSATAAGFKNPGAGPQVAESILRAPYERAIKQHQIKGETLGRGAALEQSAYEDQIKAASQLRMLDNERKDNERQDRLADSMINNRAANLEIAKQNAENNGLIWQVNKETGEGGFVSKVTGRFTPVGKFDLTTGERIENEKDVARFRSGLSFANSSRLQEDAQAHSTAAREDSQNFSREQQDDRQRASIEAILTRNAAPRNQSTLDKARQNYLSAQAEVRKAPEQYTGVWVVDPNGNYGLNPEKAGTPEYEKLREIIDAGFTTNSKVTAGGNKFSRERK